MPFVLSAPQLLTLHPFADGLSQSLQQRHIKQYCNDSLSKQTTRLAELAVKDSQNAQASSCVKEQCCPGLRYEFEPRIQRG